MRITDVETFVMREPVAQVFGSSQAWHQQRVSMLVKVSTDEGVAGWGEAYGPPEVTAAIVNAVYRPLVLGQDPFDVEVIWERLYNRIRDHGQKGVAVGAISAIDIALWDIMGRATGLPVHKLIGGAHRTRVLAYCSGMYLRPERDMPALLAAEASSYVEAGFRAMKMKIGLGLKRDVANVRAVREAIGPEVLLMVDANHGFNAATAVRVGRALEEYDIYWFEEPVPPEDLDGYLEVKQGQNIMVAGGECEFTRYGFRELLGRRAVDIVQPDTCSAGGISEARKIAALASSYHIQYVPHVWGSAVAVAAALQVLAALPPCPPGLYPVEPMLELDQAPNPLREHVATEPIRQKDSYVDVPSAPGLGIEIDEDFVRSHAR